MSRPLWFLLCVLTTLLVLPRASSAAWPTDPNTNLPVCTAVGDQYYPVMVPDGAGGAIIAWVDHRTGAYTHIYAQRVGSSGSPVWTSDGVPVCTAKQGQDHLAMASDSAGGAIAVWLDRRGGGSELYAQRVGPTGAPQWTSDGVSLAMTGQHIESDPPRIAADGVGGAIITWDNEGFIFAQRVNAAGVSQWRANGVQVCTAAGYESQPQIVSDGAGGAIVFWEDGRHGGYSNSDIFAQHVSAAGALVWPDTGLAVCTATGTQQGIGAVSDSAGGAILAWEDKRIGSSHIYAQRVSAVGALLWDPDGLPVCTAAGFQGLPECVSDGTGGAVIGWFGANGDSGGVYAQRISGAGMFQWPTDGVALCTFLNAYNAGDQMPRYPSYIVSDGSGGAIETFWDGRSGASFDVYAYRVSAGGVPQWPGSGLAICTASGDQEQTTIVPDGSGGAIIAWQDSRNGSWDIYAQRAYAGGCLDVAPSTLTATLCLGSPTPNPSSTGTRIAYALPRAGHVSLAVYDLQGRKVRSLLSGALPAGEGSARWDGRDESGQLAPSGLYFVRLEAGGAALTRRLTAIR